MTITATFKTDEDSLAHLNGHRLIVLAEDMSDEGTDYLVPVETQGGAIFGAYANELTEWRLEA